MQDLSASDLLSIELGFQTAREEIDAEENKLDSTGQWRLNAREHSRTNSKLGERTQTESDGGLGERRAADETERRISLTGAERANRWRLGGTLRRDQAKLQTRVSDLVASIRRPTGGIEVGANNEQQVRMATFTANDADDCCQKQDLSNEANEPQAGGALEPAIQIHVDTCDEVFTSKPPPPVDDRNLRLLTKQLVALHFDQPPSRSSSSIDLRADPEVGSELARTWNDKLTELRNGIKQMEQGSEQDLLLLSVRPRDTTGGSLSDGAYKLTKYPAGLSKLHKPFSTRRFESWKRANRIITNICENPLGLHLDCLDQLETFQAQERNSSNGCNKQTEIATETQLGGVKSVREQTTQTIDDKQQPKDLTNYANNLSHLYRKNQESMDSSQDFRGLLYNIICCLLVQDEQVLATASVGKMLDVIRTHLNSASRVYANTSGELLRNLSLQFLASQQQTDRFSGPQTSDLTLASEVVAVGGQDSTMLMMANQLKQSTEPANSTMTSHEIDQMNNGLQPKKQKPADFRRISSVSFNDEQLIKDLRGEQHDCDQSIVRRSGSLSTESGSKRLNEPSPWAYRELSDRRESGPSNRLNSAGSSSYTTSNSTATTTTTTTATAHYTSQSSLEQTMNNSDGPQMDLMNDSGNGTMCDSQVVSDFAGYGDAAQRCRRRAALQSGAERRAVSLCSESFRMMGGPDIAGPAIESLAGDCNHRASGKRRLSDFKPMQQPSYMSTDDYLSTTNNFNQRAQNHQRTSLYDDENSSAQLQKCDFNSSGQQQQCFEHDDEKCPSDAAARRAELEWTLNKLINIELKLTWLTSKDTLRRAIRKIGVPNEIRGKVWLILIDQMIGSKYNATNLIELARKTVEQMDENLITFDDETRSILKQIELDVNRTMPGHRLFDDGAEGGVKLRRILVAYSIHVNRAIAYCQGFNFIVALLLSVFEGNEVDALRGFICIVDHIFPSKYYFDHYLTGARADQFLLADFICDQLIKSPTMAERKMVEGVTSSITLNWFISLFHGAVPTLTRLTILDHFMLEGVKALFRFTMAILYLAFQVTPPSSCEIFTAIRNTARDMYDIKLLLSIVDQIKLPKDSYFAIRRSFYMVQSSFNSDQFYMQTFSNETSRILVANKPLNCQQQMSCPTKPPSLSLISSASNICQMNSAADKQANGHSAFSYQQFTIKNSVYQDLMQRPRTRTSSDRSKICVQSIGKLGRSHLRIIDANARSNERSLMSPLRNCTLIGISNCGKNLVIARRSSKRNFRSFKEQDLTFNIHEITDEIFDGFYLEETQQVLVITHQGELFKINHGKCLEDNKLATPNYLDNCTETLLLRDSIGASTGSMGSDRQQEKMKLRLSTMDSLTNLLWIYVECESSSSKPAGRTATQMNQLICRLPETIERSSKEILPRTTARFKHNNPFLDEESDGDNSASASDNNNKQKSCPESKSLRRDLRSLCDNQRRGSQANKSSFSRKIIIVDIITFDLFSAFALHPNFGEITNLRASLVAFCQLSNPMSNQFSTRIVQIGPTGRYEQLLSFSDVADYMVNVPDSFKKRYHKQSNMEGNDKDRTSKLQQQQQQQQRYSSLRRFLTSSISFSASSNHSNTLEPHSGQNDVKDQQQPACNPNASGSSNTLTKYYRSLMRSSSTSCAGQPMARVQAPAIEKTSKSNKFQAGDLSSSSSSTFSCDTKPAYSKKQVPKLIQDGALRSIISSSFGDFSELSETNYIPVNMAFIFRNGKIALFEFTESYAIHTRESQLDRYDYSRVIDVTKNGEDFIVTILTVCDKLIKIII